MVVFHEDKIWRIFSYFRWSWNSKTSLKKKSHSCLIKWCTISSPSPHKNTTKCLWNHHLWTTDHETTSTTLNWIRSDRVRREQASQSFKTHLITVLYCSSLGGVGLWGLITSVKHTVIASQIWRWEALVSSPDRSSQSSCKSVAVLLRACGHQLGKQAETDNRSGSHSILGFAEGQGRPPILTHLLRSADSG